MVRLRSAREVHRTALEVLGAQRRTLHDAGVPGELVLVGASSVEGAVTRGDVDLHLRVPADSWPRAPARLGRLLPVVHPGIWSSTLATFDVPGTPLPTGLAVTPVGSEHDLRFTRSWQLLRADPHLLAEFNAGKLASPDADYERRKAEFFDHLLRLWPDHPAGGRA
ncbi:hypothetical protein [Kineococcus sp. SYSU DK003]|uniref:hypothetical protein n=1 Tax=Kineococcus sp. SYSU DK003 TaxID=3383124 RepID=UPI003D7DCF6E